MTTAISISQAKQHLGKIADRAIEGEQIIIVRKSKLLVLKQFDLPDAVTIRPPGYFDKLYDKAGTKESNKLAAQSVRKIVK